MPSVCRDRDLGATGHGCTTVIPAIATQRTVFVNGKPMCKQGDPAQPHTIRVGILCVGHGAKINAGSNTVFVRGIPVARVGDSFDRGKMIKGSTNVFAGGSSGAGGLAVAGAVSSGIIGGGIGGGATPSTEGSF